MTPDIRDEDRSALLATARESISSRLLKREPRWPETSARLEAFYGVFVTLHERGNLRGCIGRMTASGSLVSTIREMARAAAFEDPRFRSLTAEELDGIDIEITVLSPLRRIDGIDEIEVGKHGIYITKGWHSGVLLPQVATEQGWDRRTFVEQTCCKAGLPAGAWSSPEAVLQIFEGLVFGEKEG
jgi:AmmeMemoRadiSam system protein A